MSSKHYPEEFKINRQPVSSKHVIQTKLQIDI